MINCSFIPTTSQYGTMVYYDTIVALWRILVFWILLS